MYYHFSMTPAEFSVLLQSGTDSELLDTCLWNEDSPFVFQGKSAAWDRFRDEFVNRLGVPEPMSEWSEVEGWFSLDVYTYVHKDHSFLIGEQT